MFRKSKIYYFLFWLIISSFFITGIANSIVINSQKFVEFGGDLDDIAGTIDKGYSDLRIKSLADGYLSVGTFVGKNGDLCTGSWLGNEGFNAVILTAAQCVFDNSTETSSGNYSFKSYNGVTIAEGESIAYFPPDHVIQADHGFGGASTDITLVKIPLKTFLISEGGLVAQPIINDLGQDTFKDVGLLGIGYWGVGDNVDPLFGPLTGTRRALGNSITVNDFANGRGIVSFYFSQVVTSYWSRGDNQDYGGPWFQTVDGFLVISAVMSSSAMPVQSLGVRTTYYSQWMNDTYPNIRLLSKVKNGSSSNGNNLNLALGQAVALPLVRDPVPEAVNPGSMKPLPTTNITKWGGVVSLSDVKRSSAVFSANGEKSDPYFYSLERIDKTGYGYLPSGPNDNNNFDYITSDWERALTWKTAHAIMEKPIRDGRTHRAGQEYVFINPTLPGTRGNQMEGWKLQQTYHDDLPLIPLDQTSSYPWIYLGKIETQSGVVETVTNSWTARAFKVWGSNNQHGTRCLVVGRQMPWRQGQADAFQLKKDAIDQQYGSLPGCEGCSNEWWQYMGHGNSGDFAQHMNDLETMCRRTKTWGDNAVYGDLFLAYQGSKEVLFMAKQSFPSTHYDYYPATGSNRDWQRIIDRDKLKPKDLEWARNIADAMIWTTDWTGDGGKDTLHYYINPYHQVAGLGRLDIFLKKKDGDPRAVEAYYPTDKGENAWWKYLGGNVSDAIIAGFKAAHNIKQYGESGNVGDLYYRVVDNALYFYRFWHKDESSLGYGEFPALGGEPFNQWWRLAGTNVDQAIIANKLLGQANEFSTTRIGTPGDLYFYYNPLKDDQLEFFVLLVSPYEDFPTDGESSNTWWQRANLEDFISMNEAELLDKQTEIVFNTQKDIDKATNALFLQDTFMYFNKIRVEVSDGAWASRFTLPRVGFDNEEFEIYRTSNKDTSVDQGKDHIYSPETGETKSFVFKRYNNESFFGDWIPNAKMDINNPQTIAQYLATKEKTIALFERFSFVQFQTYDSSWVEDVFLPDNARNGQFINVQVDSTYEVSVHYSGNVDMIMTGQSGTFRHNGEIWVKENN